MFEGLEKSLGHEKFREIFPSILTDRDPSFSDVWGIEFSAETGAQRTNLFFCDAYKSNQKASVENINKQIRKFFPKGKTVDCYTQEQVAMVAKTMNAAPLRSLDGYAPKRRSSRCSAWRLTLNCSENKGSAWAAGQPEFSLRN